MRFDIKRLNVFLSFFILRMRTLFMRKSMWTLAELEPFISPLATSTAEFNSLLTTHTRTIVKDGQKLYVPKYS